MPRRRRSEGDWITQTAQGLTQLAVTDGNLLVFSIVGVLAVGSMLNNDWRYTDEISGLPTLRGSDGRNYAYKLSPGGRVVMIYLPSGRLEEHSVTAAAARQSKQLADEVFALVEDLYLEG